MVDSGNRGGSIRAEGLGPTPYLCFSGCDSCSLSLSVVHGELQLGTWQQIVVLHIDNRARRREVVCVIVGD